ncbi:MAG: PorP/SprF family type IX secretion system membrane protein [Bacteroidia bacterium]|nr:PorP/SprF family type IX secretion system membrane protein [Bacteroidia bacterium]
MKNIKYILFILTIVFCFGQLSSIAQQLTLSNQYIVNKFSLSPAYAGLNEKFEIYGSTRNEWIGVYGAPLTNSISANGAIGKNMGIGASISNMQAGIFINISTSLYYSYHIRLSKTKFLSFGLGCGMLENHIDLNNNDAQSDPIFMRSGSKSAMIDASFGILYSSKKLHIGASAPRLLGRRTDNSLYALWPHYQAFMSYKLNFSKTWAINPTAIIHYPVDAPSFYNFTIPIIYDQKVWFTLIYKETGDAGIGIGANLKSNLIFNYTFEWYEHGLAHRSGGSHELTLGWRMNKKNTDQLKKNKKKPYYEWVNK